MAKKRTVAFGKDFVTERAPVVFPHLNTADTRFGDGVYKATLHVGGDQLKRLEGLLEEARVVAVEKLGLDDDAQPDNEVFKDALDRDKQPIPGKRAITFKMKAARKNKEGDFVPQRPILIDAHKQRVTADLWGGSEVKIAAFFKASVVKGTFYLTPCLKGVQVLKLVTSGGVAAEDMFGVEEGYAAPAAAPAEPSTPADKPAFDDDGDDGSDF